MRIEFYPVWVDGKQMHTWRIKNSDGDIVAETWTRHDKPEGAKAELYAIFSLLRAMFD